MSDQLNNEEIIVGHVDAIYFENPTNLYKVVRVIINQDETNLFIGEDIVCTGQFATLHLDTMYEFYGKITNHPKYGQQFAVNRYQQVAPTSEEGLIDYLSSDRFKGIGTVLASRIVETLGSDAIDIILSDPNALKKVNGLPSSRAKDLRDALLQHQGTERVYMQLSQWGFGPRISDKIYQTYKSTAIEEIKENPYQLIEKIDGIGFNKADQIADQLGFEADAIERIMAGIYTAVSQHCMNEGDTYLEVNNAFNQAQKLLESSRTFLITNEKLEEALDRAIMHNKLMLLADGLMIPSLFFAEAGIAKQMVHYLKYEDVERFSETEINEVMAEVEEITGIQYDDLQKEALITAINAPMSIITGGPGTGKTTLIQGLIVLHSLLHDYEIEDKPSYDDPIPVVLAAPTGRAAKRMQTITGIHASTIHRLIGFTRETLVEEFTAQELDGNLLIVDEMSMVDTWLMHWLLQAIPYHMQVVFVGDRDQLPSVGPGKVFNDLIESKVIPTVLLTRIYRQAQNSSIIKLAHDIRQNKLPKDLLEKQNDRSFIVCGPNNVANVIHQIVEKAMPKGFDATNLQVLAPMYKGPAGINSLNKLLQQQLNPATRRKHEIEYFDTIFRVGDKVLQLVNNAEDNVFNGDIGQITAIHYKDMTESKTDEVLVEFEENELIYKRNDLNQLTLAYCTSIHKAQGSEYPLVILPLVDQYSRMLRKDILYTAVTRAQSSLILLGDPNSFIKAVSTNTKPRDTFLKAFLLNEINPISHDDSSAVHQSQEEMADSPELSNLSQSHNESNKIGSMQLSLSDEEITQTPFILNMDNISKIDPMIGMDEVTPYDFINEEE